MKMCIPDAHFVPLSRCYGVYMREIHDLPFCKLSADGFVVQVPEGHPRNAQVHLGSNGFQTGMLCCLATSQPNWPILLCTDAEWYLLMKTGVAVSLRDTRRAFSYCMWEGYVSYRVIQLVAAPPPVTATPIKAVVATQSPKALPLMPSAADRRASAVRPGDGAGEWVWSLRKDDVIGQVRRVSPCFSEHDLQLILAVPLDATMMQGPTPGNARRRKGTRLHDCVCADILVKKQGAGSCTVRLLGSVEEEGVRLTEGRVARLGGYTFPEYRVLIHVES
jgi:hypothetical protein